MLQHTLLYILLLLSPITVKSQSLALEQFLQSSGLESASVGVVIQRVSDGEIIAQHNPMLSMRLASVTKLFPTWLALEQYGDEYRYTTKIYHSGIVERNTLIGNIIIAPSGDPTFNSRYFPDQDIIDQITTILKSQKINKIEGRIVFNESVQYDTTLPGSWVWEDISNYYAATPHPINFRDNSYTIEFRSGEVGEITEIIECYHKPDYIELRNEVVASSSNSDNAWIYGGPYSNKLEIRGSIPANRDSFMIRGATPSPETVFLSELEQHLITESIVIANKELSDGALTVIGSIESPTIGEIISVTNKVSCNLFAESLGILVGGQQWSSQVNDLLKERNIYCSGLKLRDASGLSPQSVASASTVSELLTYIAQQEIASIFQNSLAICGQDRGLNVYGAPELATKLKAKTGSMADVQALAGYLESKDGELLSFCILVNYFTCPRLELQRAIATLLFELYKY